MPRRHTVVTLFVVFAMAGAAVLASVQLLTRATDEPIRIAISAWAGVEPAELAARLGLYEKHGVSVQMVRFSAYTDSISSFRNGLTDGIMNTLDDSIRHQAAGRESRVVLLTDFSNGGDGIVARRDIARLEHLKGRRVGVETGTTAHFSLLKALEKSGGGTSLKDLEIINIPAWKIKEAFIAGTIDAGVTWEPFLTSAARDGGGHVLITSRHYPETIATAMVFSARVVEERPKDIQRIVDAYFEAVDFIRSHPRDAYAIMAAAEGISVDEFISHVEGIVLLDRNANRRLAEGGARRLTEELADFLAREKVIPVRPDVSRLLDFRFAAAAARR